MSKYFPHKVLVKEHEQQLKRKNHGLKTGFYMLFPDPKLGPMVVQPHKAAQLMMTQAYKDWYARQLEIDKKAAELAAAKQEKQNVDNVQESASSSSDQGSKS